MALVPFRSNGPSADQTVEERLIQVGSHAIHLKQIPKASGALIPDASNNTQVLWGGDEDDEKGAGKSNLENVGLVVWQLGFVLAELLLNHPPWGPSWQDICVIDLGTGTGVVGITLALAGARVTLTDLEHIVPLTRENVEANCAGGRALHPPRVSVCRWGSKDDAVSVGIPKPDLITAADVLYNKYYYNDLLETLSQLSTAHTVSYIAYKRRNAEEEEFMGMAEAAGFSVEVVPSALMNEEYRDGAYVVLRLCLLDHDMVVD